MALPRKDIEKNRAHSTTRFARFARQLFARLSRCIVAVSIARMMASARAYISRSEKMTSKMADYTVAVQCKKCCSSAAKQFQRKQIFDLNCRLSS